MPNISESLLSLPLDDASSFGKFDGFLLSCEAHYTTPVHEQLYCGDLGTPNEQWWPDRRGLSKTIREFEAESVCYLVCGRAGIDNPSDKYLAGYIGQNSRVTEISLECVMAGLIEKMGRERLKHRKDGARKRLTER